MVFRCRKCSKSDEAYEKQFPITWYYGKSCDICGEIDKDLKINKGFNV